jgi:hypothetical protein
MNYKYYITQNPYKCIICGLYFNSNSTKQERINHIKTKHFVIYNPKQYSMPWHDPESLFCDTKFLKKIIGKEPLKGDECRDE